MLKFIRSMFVSAYILACTANGALASTTNYEPTEDYLTRTAFISSVTDSGEPSDANHMIEKVVSQTQDVIQANFLNVCLPSNVFLENIAFPYLHLTTCRSLALVSKQTRAYMMSLQPYVILRLKELKAILRVGTISPYNVGPEHIAVRYRLGLVLTNCSDSILKVLHDDNNPMPGSDDNTYAYSLTWCSVVYECTRTSLRMKWSD
jgi:hypothetical protein